MKYWTWRSQRGGEATLLFWTAMLYNVKAPNILKICPCGRPVCRTKAEILSRETDAHFGHDLCRNTLKKKNTTNDTLMRSKVWFLIRDDLWILKPWYCDPESSSHVKLWRDSKGRWQRCRITRQVWTQRSKESLRCKTTMRSHRLPRRYCGTTVRQADTPFYTAGPGSGPEPGPDSDPDPKYEHVICSV